MDKIVRSFVRNFKVFFNFYLDSIFCVRLFLTCLCSAQMKLKMDNIKIDYIHLKWSEYINGKVRGVDIFIFSSVNLLISVGKYETKYCPLTITSKLVWHLVKILLWYSMAAHTLVLGWKVFTAQINLVFKVQGKCQLLCERATYLKWQNLAELM